MSGIEDLQRLFIDYLQANRFTKNPEGLYDPVNYIMELGGKRMRPVMLLMAYELFGNKVEEALPAAYAVEIFHNFTLVHDDIMDEAPLRRGKPTVHTKYNANTGILSGDVMLIYAYEFLLKINNQKLLPELIQIFNETAIKVCEGQQWDMDFEVREEVRIEEYLKMISYKTAALLAGSMQIGALIGGAEHNDATLVHDFAWNTGTAFQLQDDILDSYGDPEKFGKKVGGDIVQNKKTFLVLKALELADPQTEQELRELMNTPTTNEQEKIERVKSLFDRFSIRQEAEKLKIQYQDKAFQALDAIKVDPARKKTLIDIANQLLGREV